MAHAISDKISCNDTYIHVDNNFKYIWADTYIFSASAQKAELKAVGVLEVRTWSGAG